LDETVKTEAKPKKKIWVIWDQIKFVELQTWIYTGFSMIFIIGFFGAIYTAGVLLKGWPPIVALFIAMAFVGIIGILVFELIKAAMKL